VNPCNSGYLVVEYLKDTPLALSIFVALAAAAVNDLQGVPAQLVPSAFVLPLGTRPSRATNTSIVPLSLDMRGWLPLSFAVAAHFKFATVQSPNPRYRYQHQQHQFVFIAVVILNPNSPIWAHFRWGVRRSRSCDKQTTFMPGRHFQRVTDCTRLFWQQSPLIGTACSSNPYQTTEIAYHWSSHRPPATAIIGLSTINSER